PHAQGSHPRHAAGGNIIAIANPAGRLPADRLAKVGARPLYQVEEGLRLRSHRLWRPGKMTMCTDPDIMVACYRGDGGVDQLLRTGLVVQRLRPQIDPQHGE